MKVVFRADGTPQIGMGHIMRCLSLAEILLDRGDSVSFISRDDRATFKLLDDKGIEIRNLSGISPMPNKLLKEEINLVKKIIKEIRPDVIVTDSYDITTDYLGSLKPYCQVLVSIDDLAEIQFCSDIIVNPNLMGEEMVYKNKNRGVLLLGPRYFLLRNEFRNLISLREKRILKKVEKILVTMGGGDMTNLTPKVLRALADIDGDFKCDLVIGPSFGNQQEINLVLKDFPKRYQVFENPTNMAELMFEADMGICSGGGTVYEFLALGTPVLVICQTENQNENAKVLESHGAIEFLGYGKDIPIDELPLKMEWAINNFNKQRENALRGKELIDGNGCERVIDAILERFRPTSNEDMILRPVTKEDCITLWEWRNDPITRRYSINKDRIPFDSHKKWFNSSLEMEDRIILIGLVNQTLVGEIRFDIDPKTQTAEVDVAIAPEKRGKGYGSLIVKKACDYARRNLHIKTYIAKINKDNTASLNIFKKAGFNTYKIEEFIVFKLEDYGG